MARCPLGTGRQRTGQAEHRRAALEGGGGRSREPRAGGRVGPGRRKHGQEEIRAAPEGEQSSQAGGRRATTRAKEKYKQRVNRHYANRQGTERPQVEIRMGERMRTQKCKSGLRLARFLMYSKRIGAWLDFQCTVSAWGRAPPSCSPVGYAVECFIVTPVRTLMRRGRRSLPCNHCVACGRLAALRGTSPHCLRGVWHSVPVLCVSVMW